jgi:tumor protein p53-inducible protein 3
MPVPSGVSLVDAAAIPEVCFQNDEKDIVSLISVFPL